MFPSYFLHRISILFFLFFSNFIVLQAQDPTEAGQELSLNPNNLGALQNSVNLYTGQVAFPMTVASLPGRGGLNPSVTIQYNSSGVKQQVNTWNREAPTGILGLGWSLSFPKIVCNHNQTGTRHDDTFYLIEGGSSSQLVCTDYDPDEAKGYRTYELKAYQPWKVKYYYQTEKWVIEKGNGTKYVYGDQARGREDGTIQYMVRWGNWIGSSKQTEGQQEHAYIWNLSKIINLWDDELTYSYENVEEEVGFHPDSGNEYNPRHTKASALKRITGPIGNFIELTYANKLYEACAAPGDFRCTNRIREYQDPHVEKTTEPDAYQEKYEPRYLDSIKTYDESGMLLTQVDFEYDQDHWIGNGEMVKRILTGILQTNHSGKAIPKTEFEYYREDVYEGYLQSVTNSIGGVISYNYTTTQREFCLKVRGFDCFNSFDFGKRDITVTAPPESTNDIWISPMIYMGPDYAVVIWQNLPKIFSSIPIQTYEPRPSYVQIYTWDGEWVQQNIGSIGDIRVSYDIDRYEIKATLQKDHFALLVRQADNDFKINLFHRNEGKRGWEYYSENVELEDGRVVHAQYLDELFLSGGPDHVAFSSLGSERLYFYTWRGNYWDKDLHFHTTPAGYAYTGSSNFVIAHNTRTGLGDDDFWMHYRREDGYWEEKAFPGNFAADDNRSEEHREDWTYWHSAPGYAIAMADDNPEYIFDWDLEYDHITRKTLVGTTDYYPVFTQSNSLFHINTMGEDEFDEDVSGYFFRFNGKNWLKHECWDPFYMLKGSQDVIGLSHGSSHIALKHYDANQELWKQRSFTTEVPILDRNIHLIPGAALMGKDVYYLEPDGSWYDMGEISLENHNDGSWEYDLRTGPRTFYSSIPYNKTEINRIKNGSLYKEYIYNNMDARYDSYEIKNLTGNGMFAAFPATNPEKFNATSFKLYKWSEEGFEYGHTAVVVSAIHVNDGTLNLGKSYAYNYQTARMEPSGRFPMFNEVTVVNGSGDPEVAPRGYTKHYFHNGKELGDLPKIPLKQVSDETLLFAGKIYRSEIYNDEDEVVSESETAYQSYAKDIYKAGGLHIDVTNYARPVQSVSRQYLPTGAKIRVTDMEYNHRGLPVSIEKYNDENHSLASSKEKTYFTYYPEYYPIDEYNIISEVISSKKRINGEAVASNATVWSEINGVPQPVSTYNWWGFGSPDFLYWDGSTVPSQWRLGTSIEKRGAKGNVLSSKGFMGNYTATIFDDNLQYPLASASYARYEQVAATSFEQNQMGKWTYNTANVQNLESYTGTNALSAATANVSGLPTGEYVLYYWYKVGSCSITPTGGSVTSQEDFMINKGWTLRKAAITMTGTTGTITLDPSGLIDEVRIYPKGAYVTTRVYDGMGKMIAETGPDMRTTTFYYDDLDRQHYIADHKDNIVKYYEYGFKNLNME